MNLEAQVLAGLEQLKQSLQHIPTPDFIDARLIDLGNIFTSNPSCFITVAPSCLKIRSADNQRLAKIDADLTSAPTDLGNRLTNLRNKDLAYLLLLTVYANSMQARVKYNYRGSAPLYKEIQCLQGLQQSLSNIPTPAVLSLGTSSILFNRVDNVPKTPRADFSFSLNDAPKLFISHKDRDPNIKNLSDSFRQYAGVSRFSLGRHCDHPEITAFIKQVGAGFIDANLQLKDMRKGSYFAKKIESLDLIQAAIFGKDYDQPVASINNVDALLQGNLTLVRDNEAPPDIWRVGCDHAILHPRHLNGELMIEADFEPYLLIMKSANTHQSFQNSRISIWPKNTVVNNGLKNFQRFFIDKDYDSFRNQ